MSVEGHPISSMSLIKYTAHPARIELPYAVSCLVGLFLPVNTCTNHGAGTSRFWVVRPYKFRALYLSRLVRCRNAGAQNCKLSELSVRRDLSVERELSTRFLSAT